MRTVLGIIALVGLVVVSPLWSQVTITPAKVAAYGQMFAYGNAIAVDIVTNDVYHAVSGIMATGTAMNGVTFTAGSTGPISAFADYGGTVTGTVRATDTAHGLATGDTVAIVGTTNYNGTFVVTRIDADNFYFTDTWVANDGASTWTEGDYLTVTVPGVYMLSWTAAAGGASATVENYKGELVKSNLTTTTDLDDSAVIGEVSNGAAYHSMNGGCIRTLAVGDRIWLKYKQTTSGTDDVTLNSANVRIHRIGP